MLKAGPVWAGRAEELVFFSFLLSLKNFYDDFFPVFIQAMVVA